MTESNLPQVDARSEHDKGYQAGLLEAYKQVKMWSDARIDSIDPGKNAKLRTEIESAQLKLLFRLRQYLPKIYYPEVWE